ncbi:MAG: glycosyltransferase family 2 protein [Capnocytophaga sp.]|nr:glycosyltransferase family 2 protein [Capnocytophaga sp.]
MCSELFEQHIPPDDFEIIVADDGSKENHKIIIDQFNDNRIHFHRFDKNKGRPVARQKTFELMRGDYYAFLDAGDCYENNFLENAINFLSKGNLLGVSQTMKIVYKNKTFYTHYKEEKAIDIKSPDYQRMGFAPTIIKAEICKNYTFDPSLKYSQDRHFLNYLAANNEGKIMLLNTTGYIYNQGNDNIKVSTTFKKYRYDSLRLFKEGKI